MKEFAAMEWQRALRALDSAKKLVDTDTDSVASRAYYASFHAVTALFALQGQGEKSVRRQGWQTRSFTTCGDMPTLRLCRVDSLFPDFLPYSGVLSLDYSA